MIGFAPNIDLLELVRPFRERDQGFVTVEAEAQANLFTRRGHTVAKTRVVPARNVASRQSEIASDAVRLHARMLAPFDDHGGDGALGASITLEREGGAAGRLRKDDVELHGPTANRHAAMAATWCGEGTIGQRAPSGAGGAYI